MLTSREGPADCGAARDQASVPQRQAARLDALISAAHIARPDAASGLLFASHSGRALVNAAFDLFECDALYALGQDVEHELGREAQ